MRKLFSSIIITMALLLSETALAQKQLINDERDFDYKISTGGWSQEMGRHQLKVLNAILEASMVKFGPYRIIHNDAELTNKRLQQELETGRFINVGFSSIKKTDNNSFAQHKLALFNNTGGLRQFVIRKGDQFQFENITNAEQFKHLKIGQGSDWPENTFYSASELELITASNLDKLFPMLIKNRTDCVPLSIHEVTQELVNRPQYETQLLTQKTHYLFYAFPFYINVSSNKQSLSDRLQYGISKLVSSGQLKNLFESHFGESIYKLKQQASTVFVLNNTGLSTQENQQALDRVLETYFAEDIDVIPLSITKSLK